MPVSNCPECKKFLGCEKNFQEWEAYKKAHPGITWKHLCGPYKLNDDERRAIQHMNAFAHRCQEGIPA